jgi:hypothetical protein
VFLKWLHYDAISNRKVITSGNGFVGRKFAINEAKFRRWRSDWASIFSCKAVTKSFTGSKKGTHPETDETAIRSLPIARQALQEKAAETARSLGKQILNMG